MVLFMVADKLQSNKFLRRLWLTVEIKCLTFFLGWLTSSFMEAHLFRVLSRLQDKQTVS